MLEKQDSIELGNGAQIVVVKNAAHDGYRRGGMGFAKGENRLPIKRFSDAQLAQLKADPYLAVSLVVDKESAAAQSASVQAASGGDTSGAVVTDKDALTLTEAILTLDVSNPDHFTQGGKPELKVLSKLMGRNVPGAERDEAWSAMGESLDAQTSDGSGE